MWDGLASTQGRRPFQLSSDVSLDIPRGMGMYHDSSPTAKRAPEWDFVRQWTPQDPCLMGLPGFKRLEPPPFANVAFYTQNCFGGGPTWPPEDCDAPCIYVEGKPCDMPVPDPAVPRMQLEVLDPLHPYVLAILDPTSGDQQIEPLTRSSTTDEQFVDAALALILENLDLVEWVICLACTWVPDILPGVVGNPVPDPQAVIDCVLTDLAGGAKIYLVDRRYAWDPVDLRMETDPAMGWATTVGPGWDRAVVIPVGRTEWEAARDEYLIGASSGVPNARSLCMLAAMAQNIIHELLHLCAPPAVSDDANQCWAVQNMAAISFMWALAQRYPCLQTEGCCPKAGDRYFMTSEPDVPSFRVVLPGGGFGPVLYFLPYVEPAPWAFDPSIPC